MSKSTHPSTNNPYKIVFMENARMCNHFSTHAIGVWQFAVKFWGCTHNTTGEGTTTKGMKLFSFWVEEEGGGRRKNVLQPKTSSEHIFYDEWSMSTMTVKSMNFRSESGKRWGGLTGGSSLYYICLHFVYICPHFLYLSLGGLTGSGSTKPSSSSLVWRRHTPWDTAQFYRYLLTLHCPWEVL